MIVIISTVAACEPATSAPEWRVPRSTRCIVDRHTGTGAAHKWGRSIDLTPNRRGVLCGRCCGIFRANGEKLSYQFRKNVKKKG